MNKKAISQFILALCISLILIACNQNGKKEEPSGTTESTSNAMTETVQPATQDAAMDAVNAAPDLYKVASDTLGIRVLEISYKPGDSSVMHHHPDNALYVVLGGTAEFTEKDGTKIVNVLKTGMMAVRAAGDHSVKNAGKAAFKAILVEVNRPKETISQDAAMDATKVASDLYKLKSDTLGIRMVEATYKPGQSSALHSHSDNAIYVINGGTAEFTEKDGTKNVNELKTGGIMIRPGGIHSVKNTGKTTMKVLVVEVNRPMK